MSRSERLGGPARLSARQAALRLGVKIETIYAYVSRGILERHPSPDGRTSSFDASAIERLSSRRRGATKTGGLSVVLGTGLTLIEDDRVCYRGIDTSVLAGSASFEHVAEWLWLGEQRPDAIARDADGWRPWMASPSALEAAASAQRSVPEGTGPADRLRAIVSAVGPVDPLRFDLSPDAVVDSARKLIAALAAGLPECSTLPPVPLQLPGQAALTDSIASRLWHKLTRAEPTLGSVRALNAMLVLTADHGLAASTLAARVAASVRADPYSVVATGLGTLSGPLHGAASAPVHQLLEQVQRPERAVAVVGESLRREKLIPGFGHLIYTGWDPRAITLLELLRSAELPSRCMDVVECVLEMLEERAPVCPNVDFVLGAFTYASGMDKGAGEAMFGIARSAGWIAHALEEYDEPPLRFRPRAHYVGAAPEAGTLAKDPYRAASLIEDDVHQQPGRE